jgi:hypothetical protein
MFVLSLSCYLMKICCLPSKKKKKGFCRIRWGRYCFLLSLNYDDEFVITLTWSFVRFFIRFESQFIFLWENLNKHEWNRMMWFLMYVVVHVNENHNCSVMQRYYHISNTVAGIANASKKVYLLNIINHICKLHNHLNIYLNLIVQISQPLYFCWYIDEIEKPS